MAKMTNYRTVALTALNSGQDGAYSDIQKVVKELPSITAVANAIDQKSIDLQLLADAFTNLEQITAENLGVLAALPLKELIDDLKKSNYLGNRKIDIDLSLNVQGIDKDKILYHPNEAEAIWVQNGSKVQYEKAIITFVDGEVVELPFLSDNNPVNISNTADLLYQFNRTELVEAVAQEDEVYQFDVLDNTTYTVHINNKAYSYTTGNQATREEVIIGLANQINDDGNRTYTAYNDITVLRVVSDIPGREFLLSVDDNMRSRTAVANVPAGNYPTAFQKKLENTAFSTYTENSVNDIIRFYDVPGKNSNIEKIQLVVTPGVSTGYNEAAPIFYWAKTTSSLEVIANRVGDLIAIGNELQNITQVSEHINPVLEVQTVLPQLIDEFDENGNPLGKLTIFNKLNELVDIANKLYELSIIFDDIKEAGTHYITTASLDLQSTDSKIRELASDLQNTNSKIQLLYDNFAKLALIYENLINNNIDKIVSIIDDGSVSKLVSNIDNLSIQKITANIDDGSVGKIVARIDDDTFNTLVTHINNGEIPTLYNNIDNLNAIYNNLTTLLEVNVKAEEANQSAIAAATSANRAEAAAASVHTLSAQAQTLTAGSAASVTYDAVNNQLVLGIPEGPKGEKGDSFKVESTGLLADRSHYDNMPKGYSFLAIDRGELFIKASDTSGDWGPAIPFGRGEQGPRGNGIVSTTFTSTTDPSGMPGKLNAIDTYTILYDNGAESTFTVANGAGQVYKRVVSHTYNANFGEYLLCDSRAMKQVDRITGIGVVQGGTYEVQVNGASAVYVADEEINQRAILSDITVVDDFEYKVDINGEVAIYHSDPSIPQVSLLTVNEVLNDTDYVVVIDDLDITYHSDAAVKQVNTIDNIGVSNGASYKLSINGNVVEYISDPAIPQVNKLTNIVAANNTNYAVVIDGTEVTYTSGANAYIDEIRDGLISAINNDATVSSKVIAIADVHDVKIKSVVDGESFTISITAGSMSLVNVQNAGSATLAEITTGLVDAINNDSTVSADVLATVVQAGSLTIESKTAGVPFVVEVLSGVMQNAITTPNNNATLEEIVYGLTAAINNSAVHVTAEVQSDFKVKITGTEGGVAHTIVPDSHCSVVLVTASNKAELHEVVIGLVDAINAVSTAVTATDKGSYILITANNHNTSFAVTIVSGSITVQNFNPNEATFEEVITGIISSLESLNDPTITVTRDGNDIVIEAATAGTGYTLQLIQGVMSIVSEHINQEGLQTIVLPNNAPDNTFVYVQDVGSSFRNSPVTVIRNGGLINGLEENYVLNKDNELTTFVCIENNWRVNNAEYIMPDVKNVAEDESIAMAIALG